MPFTGFWYNIALEFSSNQLNRKIMRSVCIAVLCMKSNKVYPFFKFSLYLFLLLTGCSKSEDTDLDPNSFEAKVVGTWQPVKSIKQCANNNLSVTNATNSCVQKSRLIINSNTSWTEIVYGENYILNVNLGCAKLGEAKGSWKFENDRLILIKSDLTEINFTYFEATGTVLKLGYYSSSHCFEPDETAYYYTEYLKI